METEKKKVGRKKVPLHLKAHQFSITLTAKEIFYMADADLTGEINYTQLCNAIDKCRENIYRNIRG
jgi:hypothetical protein